MPAASDQSEECPSQDSDDETQDKICGGFPYTEEAKLVPHRMQQVLINWIFMIASVTLLIDFAALQDLLHGELTSPGYFAELCNWFGVVSCVSWLFGFIVLAHWLHSVGATCMSLTGCYLKVAASVFFNIQPMTGTMNDPMLGGPAGTWWSNPTGITLFHIGNLVSCADFWLHTPPGADKSRGWLYHGNLPIAAMWTYQMATWFLVAANFMPTTFGGALKAPLVVPLSSSSVMFCQMAGGFLLLFGSIIFTVWCDGFRNFSHPALGGKREVVRASDNGDASE